MTNDSLRYLPSRKSILPPIRWCQAFGFVLTFSRRYLLQTSMVSDVSSDQLPKQLFLIATAKDTLWYRSHHSCVFSIKQQVHISSFHHSRVKTPGHFRINL